MIKKKDFDKLKQNDRIEYLLRSDHLEKRKQNLNFGWISFLYTFFFLIAFLLLLSFQLKILGLEIAFISIFYFIEPLTKIIILVFFIGVISDLIKGLIIFPKWDKELDSEFVTYKTEIKNKI